MRKSLENRSIFMTILIVGMAVLSACAVVAMVWLSLSVSDLSRAVAEQENMIQRLENTK